MCFTETWLREYVSDEAVSITGYECERKDRLHKRAGGVVCYVKQSVVYERIIDVEDDIKEVLWIKLKPERLPRKYSCIIIACIYHPPDADNVDMRYYLINSFDILKRRHPECGVVLTGDFNHLYDSFLNSDYNFVQVVDKPTRNLSVGQNLDKFICNV